MVMEASYNLVLQTFFGVRSETSYSIYEPFQQPVKLLVFTGRPHMHRGLFIEEGSGGFMNDLTFYGGLQGVVFGNQQFTVRNLTFYNSVTAISQIWDWGWTYSGITIVNCSIGLDMSAGGSAAQTVGSVTFLDSTITNTKIGILTAHNSTSLPTTAGSLIVENLQLNNVVNGIQGPQGILVTGGTKLIAGYRQGHAYTTSKAGPNEASGAITPFARPASLITSNKRYYSRSKPQYQNLPLTSFVSVRTAGAKGDGKTDDSAALNKILKSAAAAGQVVFFDAGTVCNL
jgi:glucan 1,3-beta-glucosidase